MLTKENKTGAVVLDLLKAIDMITDNLLLCKIKTNGSDTYPSTFIKSYVSN